jgi:hypothetical protein
MLALWLAPGHSQAQNAERNPDGESDAIEYQLILPEEKTPESVKPNEPNPFNKQITEDDDQNSSEENAVREALISLPISGISSGPRGKRIMLGSMRLEPGMEVPDVVPNQQVHLRVNAITDTSLDMVWIEKKNTGLPPRVLSVPFNVKPVIRVKLASPTPKKTPGVDDASGTMGIVNPGRSTPASATNVATGSPEGGEKPSTPAPPPPGPPANANDPAHRANMLMNLLLNQPQPTQQPPPQQQE